MFKRIFLFILLNSIVVITISFILKFLNVEPFLLKSGINLSSLLIFSLVWGMSGSFISLMLSKFFAKKIYNIAILDPNTRVEWERNLLKKVYNAAKKSGIKIMPEVGVYSSNQINAFATGPSKNKSLVAFSSGLLNQMNDHEIEGVVGHEIAHISNGDMVTMTLLQGTINSFVIFFSRLIAFFLSMNSKNEKINHSIYYISSFFMEVILMFFGNIVIAYYSRQREYKADKTSAILVGKNKMISALNRLNNQSIIQTESASFKNLQISGKSGFIDIFSTHPSIESRIKRLQKMN